ncbi:MAG: glycosyltransferase [Nanoarchaeota archaeon]|nr:glycosyltransferase [Nanoarchaeota archaeon]MBU1501304.1 glycosyltransferase [Nanoarchaeota archaeon]
MKPKISVVIAGYNTEKYIQECLDSILNQSIKAIEIIVIDDCSKDTTPNIVEQKSRKDSRIRLIKLKQNLGRAGALNEGLKKARGEYIAFLDSDDLMSKNRLAKQLRFLETNPKISMVYSNMITFREGGTKKKVEAIDFRESPYEILKRAQKENILERTDPAKILHPKDFIPGGSVMLRKEIFDKGIKLDKELRNSEDYDLWFQIIGKGYKLAKVPIIAFEYRSHENQKSKNLEKMKIAAKHIMQKLKSGKYFQ